jgi:peptidoglycan hydrolase CwlO-like protein
MEKNVQSLQIEFAEWKSKQDYLVKHVDELRSDMTDLKKAVFQAKWMLVGALTVIAVSNTGAITELLSMLK